MRRTAWLMAALATLPAVSMAQSAAPRGLPGTTLEEAGQAAGYGVQACGLPPSKIDTMKLNIEKLVPGGSTDAMFVRGLDRASRSIQEVRSTPTADDSELKAVHCPEANDIVARIATAVQ